MTELLRRRVVALLVDQKLLDAASRVTCSPGGTPASALTIQFASSIEVCSDLWLNTSRAPRSPRKRWKKIRYESFKGRVLFHTTYSDYFKENVHLFDALDFLAELTQHIPPARVQLIRRYGLYSSRIKGHWTRMPYVLQRAPPGWTSQNDQNAATASNRAGSPEVPATETDAPDARERRHAWARLLARVYEVDALVCPRCGARLQACRRQAVISSDPESRANQKDPEPPGENRSGTAGTRSDHPRLNRLLGAE